MSDENSSSYGRVRERLDEIVAQVSSKDLPLEKSLDLYEEALRLGGMAAEMIDKTDFTEAELEAISAFDDDEVDEGDAGDPDGEAAADDADDEDSVDDADDAVVVVDEDAAAPAADSEENPESDDVIPAG